MTSMGNNTAAIYLRKSTEDDGKTITQPGMMFPSVLGVVGT